MAKHALKGMKKSKMRNIRKELKTDAKKRMQKKQNEAKFKKANDGSLQTPVGQNEDKNAVKLLDMVKAKSVSGGADAAANAGNPSSTNPSNNGATNATNVSPLSIYDNLTKKQKKTLQQAEYKAAQSYGNPAETILLVGEGNFSFAKSITQYPFSYDPKVVEDARAKAFGIPAASAGQNSSQDAPTISSANIADTFKSISNATAGLKNLFLDVLDDGSKKETVKERRRRRNNKKAGKKNSDDSDDSGAENDNSDDDMTGGTKKPKNDDEPLVREIIATCYDNKETLLKKYPDAKANIKAFQAAAYEFDTSSESKSSKTPSSNNSKPMPTSLETQVITSVDARKLSEIKDGAFQSKFDKVIFQFPHTGSGEKDREKNIAEQQELLIDFFREATVCLNLEENPKAEIHVTLKQGDPYTDWKIVDCCRKGSRLSSLELPSGGSVELDIKGCWEFEPRVFRGYAHRRTIGFSETISKSANEEILKNGAKTYVFGMKR